MLPIEEVREWSNKWVAPIGSSFVPLTTRRVGGSVVAAGLAWMGGLLDARGGRGGPLIEAGALRSRAWLAPWPNRTTSCWPGRLLSSPIQLCRLAWSRPRSTSGPLAPTTGRGSLGWWQAPPAVASSGSSPPPSSKDAAAAASRRAPSVCHSMARDFGRLVPCAPDRSHPGARDRSRPRTRGRAAARVLPRSHHGAGLQAPRRRPTGAGLRVPSRGPALAHTRRARCSGTSVTEWTGELSAEEVP